MKKGPLALSLVLVLSWAVMDVFSLRIMHAHSHLKDSSPRHYRSLPASQLEGKLDHVHPRSLIESDRIHWKRSLLPRSDTCESDIPQPLLIGVVLGIFGTLFIQGFVLVLFRMYHKNQELRNKGLHHPHHHLHHQYLHGQIPIPSAPRDFRHLEHIATSHSHTTNSSPTNSTASLLRIAHRRPDGSWVFTEPDSHSRSDTRSEISSISPFATPLPTPSSHRFPPLPSPRGVPSVPHSVSIAPRRSMDTINSVPSGYEKSLYSAQTHTPSQYAPTQNGHTHSPVASISRSAHSHSYSTARTSSVHPGQSVAVSASTTTMSPLPSPKQQQQQYYIQNWPPSSPPPPVPLPPLPTPSGNLRSEQAETVRPVESINTQASRTEAEMGPQAGTPTQSSSPRTLDEDVGSIRTGPPPYAAYIPTWREQQQMQTMPPLPTNPGLQTGKHRRI